MNRDLFLLWQGQLVSQLGAQAFNIAMMYYLMEATGSSSVMGIVVAIGMLPMILVGPFAGVLADSLSRKSIIIGADIVRGIAVLLAALTLYLAPQSTTLAIAAVCFAVVVNATMRAFFQPAISASIPDLCQREQLDKTNALFQSTTQFTQVIGQAVGGILYRIVGAPVMLLIDGISYLLSALSEAFIRMPQRESHKPLNFAQAKRDFGANFKAGLAYVKGVEGMLSTMLFVSSINLFVAPVLLLLPFYAENTLGGDAGWYGFLLATLAFGTILGGIVAAKVSPQGIKRTRHMIAAMYLAGIGIGALGLINDSYMALAAIAVVGIAIGLFNVPAMTLFQSAPPANLRGRVFSLLNTAVTAAMPLGFLLGGLAGDLTDKNMGLIYGVLGLGVAGCTTVVAFNQRICAFMASKGS